MALANITYQGKVVEHLILRNVFPTYFPPITSWRCNLWWTEGLVCAGHRWVQWHAYNCDRLKFSPIATDPTCLLSRRLTKRSPSHTHSLISTRKPVPAVCLLSLLVRLSSPILITVSLFSGLWWGGYVDKGRNRPLATFSVLDSAGCRPEHDTKRVEQIDSTLAEIFLFEILSRRAEYMITTVSWNRVRDKSVRTTHACDTHTYERFLGNCFSDVRTPVPIRTLSYHRYSSSTSSLRLNLVKLSK